MDLCGTSDKNGRSAEKEISTKPADQSLEIDNTAAAIDAVADNHRRGVLVTNEAVVGVAQLVNEFRRWSLNEAEIDLIVEYGRNVVEQFAKSRGALVEPVLIDWYDEQIEHGSTVDETQARLDLLLEPMETEAANGSAWALDSIAKLCRSGRQSHRRLFSLVQAPERILRVAYRVGHADALRDAVSPRFSSEGQIATPVRHPFAFQLAMDFLAHLAADPAHGGAARSALLDLADYLETCGEAVVRLPLHLLDEKDRALLLEVHERRVRLLVEEPLFLPLGLDLLRDNRVVQTALWQAHDARHLR